MLVKWTVIWKWLASCPEKLNNWRQVNRLQLWQGAVMSYMLYLTYKDTWRLRNHHRLRRKGEREQKETSPLASVIVITFRNSDYNFQDRINFMSCRVCHVLYASTALNWNSLTNHLESVLYSKSWGFKKNVSVFLFCTSNFVANIIWFQCWIKFFTFILRCSGHRQQVALRYAYIYIYKLYTFVIYQTSSSQSLGKGNCGGLEVLLRK